MSAQSVKINSDSFEGVSPGKNRGMLIVNADDWGGWPTATDAAMACYRKSRITAVSAMVYMEDSARAASMAKDCGIDVGLHINFNQAFTGHNCPPQLFAQQKRTRLFLRSGRYAQLVYHPLLSNAFRYAFEAQLDEFHRLYGHPPSHFDGHQHMHLCANVQWAGILPRGGKIRRNFSFFPGEKNALNRAYRSWVDRRLSRSYWMTDYFFALSQNLAADRFRKVINLAKWARVELMTHPEVPAEYALLMHANFADACSDVVMAGWNPADQR